MLLQQLTVMQCIDSTSTMSCSFSGLALADNKTCKGTDSKRTTSMTCCCCCCWWYAVLVPQAVSLDAQTFSQTKFHRPALLWLSEAWLRRAPSHVSATAAPAGPWPARLRNVFSSIALKSSRANHGSMSHTISKPGDTLYVTICRER
jgi:hypothetical protein